VTRWKLRQLVERQLHRPGDIEDRLVWYPASLCLREAPMTILDRRMALAWSTMLAGTAASTPAAGKDCAPGHSETAGAEVAPGVREVFVTQADVAFAGYGVLWVTDLMFRRGATKPADLLPNDMIVLATQGLLRVHESGRSYLIKHGGIGAFAKGATVELRNTGADEAVLRVIDLLPGLGSKAHRGAASVQ
jgi:hypothetical protein